MARYCKVRDAYWLRGGWHRRLDVLKSFGVEPNDSLTLMRMFVTSYEFMHNTSPSNECIGRLFLRLAEDPMYLPNSVVNTYCLKLDEKGGFVYRGMCHAAPSALQLQAH